MEHADANVAQIDIEARSNQDPGLYMYGALKGLQSGLGASSAIALQSPVLFV